MKRIVVMSDEYSLERRSEIILALQDWEIQVVDEGYLPLSGLSADEVLAALEGRIGLTVWDMKSDWLVLVSLTGTSFSMYLNKLQGVRCVAQATDLPLQDYTDLKPNAFELNATSSGALPDYLRLDV